MIYQRLLKKLLTHCLSLKAKSVVIFRCFTKISLTVCILLTSCFSYHVSRILHRYIY